MKDKTGILEALQNIDSGVLSPKGFKAVWDAINPLVDDLVPCVVRGNTIVGPGELKIGDYVTTIPEQAEGAQGEREDGCCCPPKGFSGAWAAGPCPVHMGLRRAAMAQPSPTCSACHGSEMVFTDKLDHNGNHIEVDCPDCAQPSPAPELVHCACGDAFPVNSYGAGFMDANNGVCQNCDAATVAQAGQVPEECVLVRREAVEYLADQWPGAYRHFYERAQLAAAPAQGGE